MVVSGQDLSVDWHDRVAGAVYCREEPHLPSAQRAIVPVRDNTSRFPAM